MKEKLSFVELIHTYGKAAYPMVAIETHEEERVRKEIIDNFYKNANIFEWDSINGLSLIDIEENERGKIKSTKKTFGKTEKFSVALQAIRNDNFFSDKEEKKKPLSIFLIKDVHHQLERDATREGHLRSLRNSLNDLSSKSQMLLFISPVFNVPTDIAKNIVKCTYELPDEKAIEDRFDFILESLNKSNKGKGTKYIVPLKIRREAVKAAKGLTFHEVENIFSFSIIANNRKFDQNFIDLTFNEKIKALKNDGFLEHMETDISFQDVGGLGNLKTEIMEMKSTYDDGAIEFGLRHAKGVLLCGLPGCGKSLLAKAIANEFGFPLFKLDIGSLFHRYVGDSEGNARKVIQTIDALGRCVVLIDELEKAFSKSAVSGNTDGGTSSKVFGTFLTWMAERTGPCFLVGTSNNHSILPDELRRKGRFDELYWLDLPEIEERIEIFEAIIRRRNRKPLDYKLDALAKNTEGFVGSEIEYAIDIGLRRAFMDKAVLSTAYIQSGISSVIPQSSTHSAELAMLRQNGQNVLKSAKNLDPVSKVIEESRKLILDEE